MIGKIWNRDTEGLCVHLHIVLPFFFIKGNKFCDSLFASMYDIAFYERNQLLTQCILVNSSTVICGTSPFVILGVLGLFGCFYSYFFMENQKSKSC